MKNKYASLVIIAVLFSVEVYADNFRAFHDSTGREIEARLISFLPKTDTVKINLKNKSVKTVKASIFSKKDQKYIYDWYMKNALLSGKIIHLTANKKTSQSKGRSTSGRFSSTGGKYNDVAYEIILNNRSNEQLLTEIHIKYCIYYDSTIDTSATQAEYNSELRRYIMAPRAPKELPSKVERNTTTGNWIIPKFSDRKNHEHLTTSVRLINGYNNDIDTESKDMLLREIEDKLLGIRVRVYIPLKSGGSAMKEFSFPSGLEKRTRWEKTKD